MAITTVTKCKAFRGIDGDNVEHDDELGRLIQAVQAWLEEECGRVFESGTVTEYYNGAGSGSIDGPAPLAVRRWSHSVLLAQPPVTSITSLYDDPLRAYGSDTLVPATAYVVADADAGLVVLDGRTFQAGLRNIKITYVGGFAAIPTDLEQAAIEMVWAAREKGVNNLIGVRSRSIADGNVQFVNLDWGSPNLDSIIRKYRLRTGVA